MKTPRLPEIELAKLTAIATTESLDQLEKALQSASRGWGWGYGPAREFTSDILGARTRLLENVATPSWQEISDQIKQACNKGEEQASSNIEVARMLYEYRREQNWSAISFQMASLSLGMSGSVRYWSDVVIDSIDGLFIPFFDHRRANGVTSAGARQVVFSMQHVGLRERYPDLMDARLAIISFPARCGHRDITVKFYEEQGLLSYEELNARVQLVYETLARIMRERTEEVRRTGTGGSNPFKF